MAWVWDHKLASGTQLAQLTGGDRRSAKTSLKDEAFNLVLMMEANVGTERFATVAVGSYFDPLTGAVESTVLNGHKTQYFAESSADLKAPPGPLVACYAAIISSSPLTQCLLSGEPLAVFTCQCGNL